MHLFRLIFVGVLLTSLATAKAQDSEVCDGITNLELISCTSNGYKRADKRLNETYRDFMSQLSEEEGRQLKSVQIIWIKFKEKHCQDIYDATYPGQEAPIEKNACLWTITKNRTDELNYIKKAKSNNYTGDKFSEFLELIHKNGYNKGNMTNKFINIYLNEKEWNNYVEFSCNFSSSYIGERERSYSCRARHNFLRDY